MIYTLIEIVITFIMGISIDVDTRNFLDMLKAKMETLNNSYPNKLLISGMGGSG